VTVTVVVMVMVMVTEEEVTAVVEELVVVGRRKVSKSAWTAQHSIA